MRIVFVGPVPPLRGGIAQHSAQLVTALRARGHHVDVWSWASQYPAVLYPGRQLDPNALPFPGTRFRMRWWDPTSWVRAGRSIRGADLLLVTWVVPPQAVAYRAIRAAAGGTPVVAVVHNPLPHEPGRFDRVLARLLLPHLAGAVCHASSIRERLDELAPGVPVETVAHPPNLPIHPRPLPGGPPWKLLFLGHLRPYKGLDVALGALRQLVDGDLDVSLTVAGNPWRSPDEWRADVAALGITDHVHFRFGYVPDDEMDELLASHHLLVAPYVQATQSGVVPLAHAAGRPAVATDVGGLPEAVRHDVDGVIVAAGDPTAFAAGVRHALGSLDRLAAGALSATERWDDVAQAVERLAPGPPARR
jgi:glycosyltransferase involved in cell wall biosynthesis